MDKVFIANGISQTQKVARDLAKQIIRLKNKKATIIGLIGELGSGKTTFVQGFAKALGIKKRVISPTFIIEKIYALRVSRFSHLIHIDAYRISKPKEIINLRWKELIKNPKNIIIIEWADKIKKILPKKYIQINFRHKDKNKRWIKIKKF
ncbi:MAG: tRNA (adenosine(37)-N6)-threonylcarbamoyltransferase complex ATPase subunit type 1 TsaE [Patescibacteria group bacterium]